MKKILVVVGMIAVAGVLYSCGGGGGGGSSSGGGGTTTTVTAPTVSTATPISTQADAAKTVNSSKTLASAFASGSSFPSLGSLVAKPTTDQAANGHKIIDTVRDIQQRVAGLVEKQKSLGKRVAAATSYACTDGGTMSFDTASNPAVYTFAACKQGNEYMNGTMTLSGLSFGQTSSTTGGTASINLTTISYAYGGYTTKLIESVMNMTMTIGSYNTTTGSESMSINGYETNVDYTANTSDKQSFGSFSLDMTESTSGAVTNISMTLNGAVTMDTFKDTTFTTIDTASGMTFQNLVLTDTFNSTTYASSLTINGTYAIKTIPACMDGTFVITTSAQTPITINSSGMTTGGKMTVNGVVMVFNSDGTVTATINGSPLTITSYADVCSLSF